MRCYKCKNEIIIGKRFCSFCGNENTRPPASFKMDSDGQQRKSDFFLSVLKVIFFVVFIILPMTYGSLWGNTTKETPPPCMNTTRNLQNIVKVDGTVDSFETEMVDGCETPDGTFYKRPDF